MSLRALRLSEVKNSTSYPVTFLRRRMRYEKTLQTMTADIEPVFSLHVLVRGVQLTRTPLAQTFNLRPLKSCRTLLQKLAFKRV